VAIAFIIGAVTGIVGTILLPPLLRPYIPTALRGAEQVLDGVVVAKGTEGERLLITLSTPQGTTLATFTKETAKIDLLVREGDSLALAVREYGPFVENPRIARVVSSGAVPRAGVPDTAGLTTQSPPP
jgi:hypothetical protein